MTGEKPVRSVLRAGIYWDNSGAVELRDSSGISLFRHGAAALTAECMKAESHFWLSEDCDEKFILEMTGL